MGDIIMGDESEAQTCIIAVYSFSPGGYGYIYIFRNCNGVLVYISPLPVPPLSPGPVLFIALILIVIIFGLHMCTDPSRVCKTELLCLLARNVFSALIR